MQDCRCKPVMGQLRTDPSSHWRERHFCHRRSAYQARPSRRCRRRPRGASRTRRSCRARSGCHYHAAARGTGLDPPALVRPVDGRRADDQRSHDVLHRAEDGGRAAAPCERARQQPSGVARPVDVRGVRREGLGVGGREGHQGGRRRPATGNGAAHDLGRETIRRGSAPARGSAGARPPEPSLLDRERVERVQSALQRAIGWSLQPGR